MISNVINYSGMFVLAVLITRILGVDALGEFTYIFAVISIISIISELGLSQLLIRKINENRSELFSLIKNVNIFKSRLTIITVILSVAVLYFFESDLYSFSLVTGIAAVIPKVLYSTYDSSIRALQKQAIPSILKSISVLIQIAAGYLIIFFTGSLLNLFILILISESLTALVFYFINSFLWKKTGIIFSVTKQYSYAVVKPVIKEALPFWGSAALALSIPRIIMIILENIAGAASLGIFSAASRFANGVGLFSGALYNTFYPAMSNAETPANIRYTLARKFTLYAFLSGIIISLAIYFSAEQLIDLTFRIPEAVPVLKLLGFSVIPVLTFSVIQPFLFSTHNEKFILRSYSLAWLLNIILTIFIIHHHGYIGAAVGNIIIEYIILIILFFKFRKIRS